MFKNKKKDKKQKKEKKDKKEKKVVEEKIGELELFGTNVRYNDYVRVEIGPIVGEVTTTSAIVLLEVNADEPITAHFVPFIETSDEEDYDNDNLISQTLNFTRQIPKAFKVTNLKPGTSYRVFFSNLSRKALKHRQAIIRTFPEKITKLSIAAISCDRPERVLDGETNMWGVLDKKLESGEIQIVLHLGDQVYGQKELVDSFVILRQAHQDGLTATDRLADSSLRTISRLADIYRFTWNLQHTARSLASGSHLMIWSDNDLYNDFTIAKADNGNSLSNAMIHFGHLAYRRYQRQLWDVDYDKNPTHSAAEQHFHKYGPVGVLLLDMRGNRIDWNGNQLADNPFINDAQWKMFDDAFADPEIKVMLITSEIPFVGDAPDVLKKNAEKPETEFLKDHWGYNLSELTRILETAFNWKAATPGREIVFIGGDIHVGVESVITDSKTGLSAVQLTATPITNHVCKFFPKLEGRVNDRFSYVHKSVTARNYGLVDITVNEGGAHVESRLILDPSPQAHGSQTIPVILPTDLY